MNSQRFDTLTRQLGVVINRRSLLSAGIGALSAGVGRGLAVSGAQAPCTTDLDCGPLQDCVEGVCLDPSGCPVGLVECANGCFELQTDLYNCGACGNFCGGIPAPGYSSIGQCVAGECRPVCSPEADECDGQCTDLSRDVLNCGTCGNQCGQDQICCSGGCVEHDSAERFCDDCGFQAGWPQGCNDDEVCSGGICLPAEGQSEQQPGAESEDVADSPPAVAAFDISVLESQGDFDALYDLMHPDAQIVVPRGVVTYWYATYFAPLGPQPLTVSSVDFDDWTWEVIGRTFPGTATVAFQQPFSNGPSVSEVVRLVQDVDGKWRWFFGRSADFVAAMTAEAAAAGAIDALHTLPEKTDVALESLFSEAILSLEQVLPDCLTRTAFVQSLPQLLQGAERQDPVQSATSLIISYLPQDAQAGDAYPDLQLTFESLDDGNSPEMEIEAIGTMVAGMDETASNGTLRAFVGDVAPTSTYRISYVEEFNDAVGYVSVVKWGVRGGSELFTAAGPAIVALNELMSSWSVQTREDPQCSA